MEQRFLHGPGRHHVIAHDSAGRAGLRRAQFLERHGGNFDVQVDAIQ